MFTEQIEVLYVGDAPDFTDMAGTQGEHDDNPLTVSTTTTAEDGLRLAGDRTPDCVVSDYSLPDADGLEFLATVRETDPEMPFILYADAGKSVASEAISAGVTDYVERTSDRSRFELLAHRIRNAVQARRDAQRVARQDRLTRLTEHAGEAGNWEIDLEDETVLLTDGTSQLIGGSGETMLSLEEGIQMYHPADQQSVRRALDRAAETGKSTAGTWRLQTIDGDERLLDVNINPVKTNGDVTTVRGAINDVTRQQERTHELERTETLVENTQDAMFLVDVADEFTLEQVNPAWEEMTGLSAGATHGETLEEVFGAESATMEARLEECRERREPVQYEDTVELGGETKNVETMLAPVEIDDTVTSIAGSVRDVTERRQQRAELEAERQFTEQALDSLEDLFYVIGEDGRLQRWNDRVPEVTGYSQSELSEMPAVQLFPEEERESITDAIESAVSGERVTVEADLLTADGQRIPCEFTGAYLTDPNGETRGIVGIGRDLTGRRRRERRFRAFVEESSDIISVVDADGRYQYQSPSLERVLGYDTAETIGDLAWEYIHPDDREAVREAFQQALTTSGFDPVRYRARHANGSWRWMEARGSEQLVDSAVDGFVVNSRDITERKQRKKQVEVLDRVLRHNLRNKMSVILSQAELIRSQASDETAARAEQIVETSDRLVEIAEKEREITKVVQQEPTYQETAIRPMLERVASTAERTYSGATVVLDCPDSPTARVPGKFEDAVSELVTNGIVHDDSPSPHVTLTAVQTDDGFCVEVADTGPQITRMERDILVDRQERTQLSHGDGLGLLLVKRIVAEAGGTVTIRENAPRGNIIQITLPA